MTLPEFGQSFELRELPGLKRPIEKGQRFAAHVFEAAEADIQYRGGVFEIIGTDRKSALFELADRDLQVTTSV
jgi:hypothetical protein